MSKPLPKLLEWVNFQISYFNKVAADEVKIIDYHARVYTSRLAWCSLKLKFLSFYLSSRTA